MQFENRHRLEDINKGDTSSETYQVRLCSTRMSPELTDEREKIEGEDKGKGGKSPIRRIR